MTMLGTFFLAMTVAAEAAVPAATDSPAISDEAVGSAIERSLPYLEKDGVAWIEERKCTSCHQVPGMLWGFNAARRSGAGVDAAKLAGWSEWSFDFATTNKGQDNERDGGGLDTMTHLIAGRDYDRDDEAMRAKLIDLAGLIVAEQQDDGSWKPDGQLPGQTRPLDETTQVSTAWAVVALSSIADLPDELAAGRDKALAFLKQAAEGQSGEWWAVMLLVEHQHGDPRRVEQLQQKIFELQNDDGGWSFVPDDGSSPLATGQILYALAKTGVPADRAEVARARRHLIDTQRDDGSWAMKSTLKRKNGEIYPIGSFWGTGWAVAGLAESLAP